MQKKSPQLAAWKASIRPTNSARTLHIRPVRGRRLCLPGLHHLLPQSQHPSLLAKGCSRYRLGCRGWPSSSGLGAFAAESPARAEKCVLNSQSLLRTPAPGTYLLNSKNQYRVNTCPICVNFVSCARPARPRTLTTHCPMMQAARVLTIASCAFNESCARRGWLLATSLALHQGTCRLGAAPSSSFTCPSSKLAHCLLTGSVLQVCA